ncbi:MFS transporter [Luteococcus sp. H138]|uniref:MFS transporter n=1 Tax=unclassified Luteococcus TaxID=2639923 RepID=UPI00313C758D
MTHAAIHPAAPEATITPMARKAAVASFLGGTLEYYDFFIYATAASLVFSKIFFPAGNPAVATVASLATFGVAYIARPIGALVLGHFGDKIGRKNMLVVCLLLMGFGTIAIGFIPSYAWFEQHTGHGWLAPTILVLCRLVQGFSAGGETAGASTLTIEHAPAHRRAFLGSWTMNGIAFGFILASLVFIPVAAMPDEQLLHWGWRIPFLSSVLVLVVAFFVRRTLEEPEIFEEDVREETDHVLPVLGAFRDHWRDILRLTACGLFTTTNTMMQVFGLAYGSQVAGISRTTMLWIAIASNVVALFGQTFAALAADRWGRRPIFIIGALGIIPMIWLYFLSISTGNIPLVFLAGVVMVGIFYSMPNGIYPAFFTEMFSTKVRYTGMAVGLQFALVVSGFAPSLASSLVGNDKTHWQPAAWIVTVVCLIAAIGAFTARETYRTPTEHLGKHQKAE